MESLFEFTNRMWMLYAEDFNKESPLEEVNIFLNGIHNYKTDIEYQKDWELIDKLSNLM